MERSFLREILLETVKEGRVVFIKVILLETGREGRV